MSAPFTPSEIAERRAILAAATPGPWTVCQHLMEHAKYERKKRAYLEIAHD